MTVTRHLGAIEHSVEWNAARAELFTCLLESRWHNNLRVLASADKLGGQTPAQMLDNIIICTLREVVTASWAQACMSPNPNVLAMLQVEGPASVIVPAVASKLVPLMAAAANSKVSSGE